MNPKQSLVKFADLNNIWLRFRYSKNLKWLLKIDINFEFYIGLFCTDIQVVQLISV